MASPPSASPPAELPRPAPAALVFDLDGTLVDSGRDIGAAVNLTRRDLGLPALPVPTIVALIGEGARVLMQRALPADSSDAAVDEALRILLSHYDRTCVETTVPYRGIPRMLEELGRRVPLALLTNKPERATRKILEHLDLARFFRLVVGGDTLPTRKPDPATMRHVGSVLGVPVASLLLVGDSRVDAETAEAAGARFALAGWGYGGSVRADAEFRTGSVGDMARALAALFRVGLPAPSPESP